jgi:hypothetical protein
MLSYLHHARNAEEHSIDGSANPDGGDIVAGSPETRSVRNSEGVATKVIHPQGVPIDLKVAPPGLRLLRVTDSRFHDTFHPPTQHLGADLVDATPAAVARLGLTYLEGLIAEARPLPAH